MANSKGFGKSKPIPVKDGSASPGEQEQPVLDKVSQEKLKSVRELLDAGKAAIAATQSTPGTAKVLKVTDAAQKDDDTESESVEAVETAEAEKATEAPAAVSMDAVQSLLKDAIAAVEQRYEDKLTTTEAAYQQQIDELKKAAAEGAEMKSILKSLEGLQGNPIPATASAPAQQLTVVGTGSAESRGYLKMLEQAPAAVVMTRKGQRLQRDLRATDAYLYRNREKVRDGIEAEMREAGFFQGSGSRVVASKDALTVASDIPSISYEYLSAMIRMTHYEDLIHWQFARNDIEIGVRPGLTMGIPRYSYLARPTAFADRVLTPGTRLNSGNSALSESIVPVTIQELGLGKNSDNPPIGISTFISAYSMTNLEDLVMRNLGRDYQYTKDLGLRSQWDRTDRVVYNNGGSVTTTATDVGVADGGHMTDAFTVALNAYLYGLQIPAYDDAGNYGLALNPTAASQFLVSKGAKERDMALESGMDLVTRAVRQSSGFEGGEVTGYLGLYNGFHMFRQNVYGLVGGTDGVTSTPLGDSNSYDLLTSYAFGRDTIGWGTAMPVEIRMDNDDDFQREMRAVWISHEAAVSLDVKTTAETGEQLRVVEIRTTQVAI